MYYLHLTRNLRSLAFLLIVLAVLAAIGILGWANYTGLPEPWRAAIEQEAAKKGAYLKIGSLRLSFLRGIIATQVRVYSGPEHLLEISRLEQLTLDFDKTKLARGVLHLNKVQLNHAKLFLPVEPNNPQSEILEITDANGTLLMPEARRWELREAHGKIAGIKVTLNANIIGFQQDGQKPAEESNLGKRRQLLANIIRELSKWQFNPKHPPALQISIEGDINDHSSITAKLGLQVKDMAKNDHLLTAITATADLVGDLFTLTSLHATDKSGVLDCHADYNMQQREGRFDLSSSLEVPQLLTAWLGLPALKEVTIGGKQVIEAEGNFQVDQNNTPQIQMTGNVRCESVKLLKMPFDALEGAFAWRDDNLFIRDLHLTRPDGFAEGKVMIKWPVITLKLHSTLPVPVYRPFFVGQPLEIVLNDFTEREGAAVEVSLEGYCDVNNHLAWAYTGSGAAKNLNYKGVPINAASSKFSLNHQELDFYDGMVVFNYSKYALRKAFNGPNEATAKVGRIRYDASSKTVLVEDVRGAFWAAPMVRFFAPKVADTLEQYRFHQPPQLKGSGVVDTTPQGRTALNVSFSSDHPADYVFLGENLSLSRPSAQVSIHGEKVTINHLLLDAFTGPVVGHLDYLGAGKLTGDLSWTKLSIPDLTSTYGFQMKGGGTVTGRIDFSLSDNKIESMVGTGLLALENAELFSVPMFGPLTPLIVGVLNNADAGFQHAKDAFCTFKIQNGILNSQDFQTSTSSLNFVGNGSIDMRDRTLDLTMRMNARGLLKLLTLPLRPFSELFQFHGTGTLKSPQWESMGFASAPEPQAKILSVPPKAKVIVADE